MGHHEGEGAGGAEAGEGAGADARAPTRAGPCTTRTSEALPNMLGLGSCKAGWNA